MKNTFVILILLVIHIYAFELPTYKETLNLRPVLGMFDMPVDDVMIRHDIAKKGDKFIPAEYVRYFQMAGARIMMIPHDISFQEQVQYFKNTNGLFFAGGQEQHITLHEKQRILAWVKQTNLQGSFFPLLGVCMGFEHIVESSAQHYRTILDELEVEDETSRSIQFINQKQSYIFKNLPKRLKINAENAESAFFQHNQFLTIPKYHANRYLHHDFFITSTSQLDDGTIFITSIEGRKFPIVAFQFHPEQPIFEWKINLSQKMLKHSSKNIEFGQFLADRMTILTRYNFNEVQQEFVPYIIEEKTQVVFHMPESEYTGVYIFRQNEQM